MEINLRPHSVVREQNLAKRKPFLVLAASCLVLAPAVGWLYFNRANSITQTMLDGVSADVGRLEAVAKQFNALDAETKRLQDAAGPLILAVNERVAWAQILEELGAKLPPRFIWVTEIKALSGGKPYVQGAAPASSSPPQQQVNPSKSPSPPQQPRPQSAEQPKIDGLELSGLYLANPPNEKEARIIDEFVDKLQASEVFKVEEKDKAKVVIQRTTPDGQSWAYGYTLILPLRNPISLP
jgi:hypothetical protein